MRITLLLLLLQVGFGLTPDDALKRLMDGNGRYIKDALQHPNRTSERREATTAKQFPYAVIVGCSDSRVAPEIIFDEGVGDLFVVRVAGNVIGQIEQESIQYAVQVLGSVFILVLGHENCGAVQAVVDGKTETIPAIASIIEPAIQDAKEEKAKDLLASSIKENAIHMKDLILQSSVIKSFVDKKKVALQPAYYNLQTGKVDLL